MWTFCHQQFWFLNILRLFSCLIVKLAANYIHKVRTLIFLTVPILFEISLVCLYRLSGLLTLDKATNRLRNEKHILEIASFYSFCTHKEMRDTTVLVKGIEKWTFLPSELNVGLRQGQEQVHAGLFPQLPYTTCLRIIQ